MKKNNTEKKEKKSLFTFNKDKELEKAYQPKERGIRHIEDPMSFLGERDVVVGEYGHAEDLTEEWGLSRKDSNIKGRKRRVLVRLVIAALVGLLILGSIFFFLPAVLPSFFKDSNIELFVAKEVNLEYDASYRVIAETYVSVTEQATSASKRVTQLLYNEPVELLEEADENGFIKIRTLDGLEGYIEERFTVANTTSVEPDLHEYKLVVSEASKNIMSHASQGTLIKKVDMNTVLYADVKRDGVYQVSLPGGGTGWIGSSGVIEIDPRAEIEAVSCRYFVSSALSLVNSMYVENGVTLNGMSMNGMVYVCSAVNGVTMPRTMQEQAEMGEEVTLTYDVVTGEMNIGDIIPGDIVFLRSPYSAAGSKTLYEMAICTDTGTLLMVSSAGTTIRLRTFTPDSELCSRIIMVRRIFAG